MAELRRYKIVADGPDGKVPHFYADHSEPVVTAIDKRDVEPLLDLLSACKQWRQATESRLRLIDRRGEAAASMLPADRALCEAIERVES